MNTLNAANRLSFHAEVCVDRTILSQISCEILGKIGFHKLPILVFKPEIKRVKTNLVFYTFLGSTGNCQTQKE